MGEFYHSYLSPYARRVLIVLAEKGMEHLSKKHKFAREFEALSSINPCNWAVARKRAQCSPKSTAGSPRDSTPPISRTPKLCSTN